MGNRSLYFLKSLQLSRYAVLFLCVFVGAFALNLTTTDSVFANGEKYTWKDKDTIAGSNGSYGGNTKFFSKGINTPYPRGSGATELYIYDDSVRASNGCDLRIGIQVNGNDKSKGTLKRINDPVFDAGSNACPAGYTLSNTFTTSINLGNSGDSGSNPSTVVTITIRSLVEDGEDFPGTGDTFTLKNAGSSNVLVTRKATDKHAYSKDGMTGFERTFKLETTPGQKNYEACSSALSQCSTGDLGGTITAPLGIYVFDIVKKPVDDSAVCSAGALGWVICPLTDFISDATQTIAGIIEDQLIYPPLLSSDQGTAIRTVWGTVLGIANLGLVLTFLIIIFSQATSVGLSSYGIKKILPRLIAAAILMNLSFFLCAIAVDLANILGVSIKGIVQAGIQSIDAAAPASDIKSADGTSWRAGVVGILGLGVAAYTGAIAFLLPVILAALIAVFTAFLVIAARGVIVTMLIIVAPLAFLAWILPNTEQWFTKWRKLFTTMLLMFPLVMIVFYGSLLVSRLVLVTTAGGSDGDPKIMTNIIALAILTVPLFSLPFIMKSAGGVLDRFGVIANNRSKGLIDRSRKTAQGSYDARKNTRRMNINEGGRTMNPWKANMRRQATRDHRRGLRKGIAEENSQEYIAKKALKGGEGRLSYSGRMVNSANKSYIAAVQASAQATVDKQDRQSIANREVLMRAKYNSEELIGKARIEFENAVSSTDSTGARAAQNILLNSGTPGLDALSGAVSKMEATRAFEGSDKRIELKEGVKKDLNSAGLKPKQNALATWSYDDRSLTAITNDGSTYTGLNDSELVGQTADNIGIAVNKGVIGSAKAQSLLDNPSLQGALNDKKRDHLKRAISGTPPASGGPTPPPTPPPTSPSGGPSGGGGPTAPPPSSGDSPPTPSNLADRILRAQQAQAARDAQNNQNGNT